MIHIFKLFLFTCIHLIRIPTTIELFLISINGQPPRNSLKKLCNKEKVSFWKQQGNDSIFIDGGRRPNKLEINGIELGGNM